MAKHHHSPPTCNPLKDPTKHNGFVRYASSKHDDDGGDGDDDGSGDNDDDRGGDEESDSDGGRALKAIDESS